MGPGLWRDLRAAAVEGFAGWRRIGGRMARGPFWRFLGVALALKLLAIGLDAAVFGLTAVQESRWLYPPDGAPREVAITSQVVGRGPLSILATLMLAPPVVAAGWRRLQDVGLPGWLLAVPLGLAVAGLGLAALLRAVAPSAAGAALGPLALAEGVCALALLAAWLWRGQAGANRYGPP